MSQFLDADGYINVAEFIALARDIDRMAVKEGLKPANLYFSKKAIVKADHPSASRLDEEAFTKKRAQPIKEKARMPASGSRVRMMVLLRNYKGLEQYDDFFHDYQLAVKAIERHNARADKVIERLKTTAAKKRDTLNAAFDKNLNCFIEEVLKDENGDFLAGVDAAVGTSMMGKTLIVQLPNGGYVSIGKADAERFEKAQASEAGADAKPAARGKAAPSRAAAKPARAGRTAAPTRAAKPTRTTAAPVAAKSSRAERRAARMAAEEKPVRKARAGSAIPPRKVRRG